MMQTNSREKKYAKGGKMNEEVITREAMQKFWETLNDIADQLRRIADMMEKDRE